MGRRHSSATASYDTDSRNGQAFSSLTGQTGGLPFGIRPSKGYLSSIRRGRKNWVEPLRKWILDSQHAGFLASSTNYAEIREFVRSFGTNPAMRDKTISVSFCPPSEFARTRLTHFARPPRRAPQARGSFALTPAEVSECDPN